MCVDDQSRAQISHDDVVYEDPIISAGTCSATHRPEPTIAFHVQLFFLVLIQARMFRGLGNRVRQKLLSRPHRCTRKESQCDQDAQRILVVNRTRLCGVYRLADFHGILPFWSAPGDETQKLQILLFPSELKSVCVLFIGNLAGQCGKRAATNPGHELTEFALPVVSV